MSSVWIQLLLKHLAAVLVGVLIGFLYGIPIIGFVCALLGLLAWHLFNLYRLERWMQNPKFTGVPDGDGVWARVFARAHYMNDRVRRSRKKLRQLVKELRSSTKAFPDGGIVLNPAHEILNYNRAARRLLGLKKKNDRGQRIDNLIRHPDFVEFLANENRQVSVEIPAPSGNDVWLSCRLIPYGPQQLLLLIHDITQSVKTEAMRRDFVANASHELRSPLTVIGGYLDALAQDEELPLAWAGPIGDMREQTERMSHLVRDLLQLSSLESGAPGPMDRSIDMAALLTLAQKEALMLTEHPQRVELELESQQGLLGEEAEIQSIVSNLVSNAVRYTPSDGSVVIRWQVDQLGGHLTVEDSGIGIAEEDIPRLTERFFRADAGRVREQGGTGLGLAIVKHALKRHDGELEVRSRMGAGSEFICHFSPQRLAAQ